VPVFRYAISVQKTEGDGYLLASNEYRYGILSIEWRVAALAKRETIAVDFLLSCGGAWLYGWVRAENLSFRF
jgi:hypothetical protein